MARDPLRAATRVVGQTPAGYRSLQASRHKVYAHHKTLMEELGTLAKLEELGTPAKLMDERIGHDDGSVQTRYPHVTPEMRRRLMGGLTEVWETPSAVRRAISPGSPVSVLDRLLGSRVR